MDPALAEYERTKGLALAEYERTKGLAWAEYERVEGLALAKLERTRGLAVGRVPARPGPGVGRVQAQARPARRVGLDNQPELRYTTNMTKTKNAVIVVVNVNDSFRSPYCSSCFKKSIESPARWGGAGEASYGREVPRLPGG